MAVSSLFHKSTFFTGFFAAVLHPFSLCINLNNIFESTLTLRSGGYIVINPTEALISIDVNSGKSIKEINVERTALATNLEAAEEISRQIKI